MNGEGGTSHTSDSVKELEDLQWAVYFQCSGRGEREREARGKGTGDGEAEGEGLIRRSSVLHVSSLYSVAEI